MNGPIQKIMGMGMGMVADSRICAPMKAATPGRNRTRGRLTMVALSVGRRTMVAAQEAASRVHVHLAAAVIRAVAAVVLPMAVAVAAVGRITESGVRD